RAVYPRPQHRNLPMDTSRVQTGFYSSRAAAGWRSAAPSATGKIRGIKEKKRSQRSVPAARLRDDLSDYIQGAQRVCLLVPTLCVGTQLSDALRPAARSPVADGTTQSVVRSAFPRGAWERGSNFGISNTMGGCRFA